VIVALLSIGAGVAIAGLPNNVSVDATITPPTSTETPASTVPETTEPDTTEPATTEPDTSEPDTSEPDTSEPDTTEAVPGELPDRSELSVVAANGANVAGAAGAAAAQLQEIGYVDVLALNGTDIFEFTTVYYAEGFEEAALRMAEDLNLLPDFVAPIEDAPGVADLPADTELLSYIGRDRA